MKERAGCSFVCVIVGAWLAAAGVGMSSKPKEEAEAEDKTVCTAIAFGSVSCSAMKSGGESFVSLRRNDTPATLASPFFIKSAPPRESWEESTPDAMLLLGVCVSREEFVEADELQLCPSKATGEKIKPRLKTSEKVTKKSW